MADRNKYLQWVKASILKHFKAKVALSSGSDTPVVRIDWIDNQTVDDVIVDMSCKFNDITRVEKMIMVDLNLIIRVFEGDEDHAYKSERFKGYVLDAVVDIPMHKLGPDGDGSYFNCLQHRPPESGIEFLDHGETQETGKRMTTATCRTSYRVHFVITE